MKTFTLLLFLSISFQSFGDAICAGPKGGHVEVIENPGKKPIFRSYSSAGVFIGQSLVAPLKLKNCKDLSAARSMDMDVQSAESQNRVVESSGADAAG